MGILIRRPNPNTSSGGSLSTRQDVTDGSDATVVNFSSTTLYIWNYDSFALSQIPAGRKVVGVRVAHRISNSGSYNGWPEAYLRYGGARVANSRLHVTGPQLTSLTTQKGPVLYKSGNTDWTEAEVNQFTSDHTRYVWNGQGWYRMADHWMEVVYNETLAAPTTPYPANSATIATSSVNFEAVAPAPQAEQLVRVVFQVARDNTFTSDVRTFYSAYHGRTAAGEKAFYTSVAGSASDTNLGPGVWYLRMKTQDVISTETAWSSTTSFTITHAALPTTVNTAPAPNALSATPYGVRSARVDVAASDSRTVGVEWQFSQSNTFESGVVTWKNLVNKVTTGTVSYNAEPKAGTPVGLYGYDVSPDDPSQYLPQGVWYVRSRTVDKWNQTSDWSTTDTFTVSHPPQAQNVTPASNQVIDQAVTPVRWTFADAWSGDAQTAYQIKVYDASNNLIYDSDKTSSTALQHFLSISNTYLYLNLRYTVNLWDLDDVTPAQVSSNTFVFSQSPAIVQSYPAQNEEVLTGQPTFVWNPGIARPGTTQYSYELKVYRQSDNVLVYNSGVVVSTATTHTPPQVILRNGIAYRETLRIVDSDGLSSTLNRDFTASYQAPPDPIFTVDATKYLTHGYVDLDWSSTVPDDFFNLWKVYRRLTGQSEWELIAVFDDPAVRSYHDWMVPSVDYYEYAVTQLADRSGFILESSLPEEPESHYVASEDYWIIGGSDESQFVRLYAVTDDKFTVEVERSEYVIKGRGRRVNYGTRMGINGSLSVKLRSNASLTAREQKRALERIQDDMGTCILRDPFGNLTNIALGDISITRVAGVGLQEFVDAEIPYMEVAD